MSALWFIIKLISCMVAGLFLMFVGLTCVQPDTPAMMGPNAWLAVCVSVLFILTGFLMFIVATHIEAPCARPRRRY